MTDPTHRAQEGGDVPATGRRQLARPPGARYGAAAEPTATPRRTSPWLVAVAIALGGAVAIALLGLIDVSLGLLAVAAALGWALGEAVRGAPATARTTRVIAATAAGDAAILLGLLLTWAWSLTEGGVLGPLAYVAERYGLLAVLLFVVAGGVAALRAR